MRRRKAPGAKRSTCCRRFAQVIIKCYFLTEFDQTFLFILHSQWALILFLSWSYHICVYIALIKVRRDCVHAPLTSDPSNKLPQGKHTNNVNSSHLAKACQSSLWKQVYRKRRSDYNEHFHERTICSPYNQSNFAREELRMCDHTCQVCLHNDDDISLAQHSYRATREAGGRYTFSESAVIYFAWTSVDSLPARCSQGTKKSNLSEEISK